MSNVVKVETVIQNEQQSTSKIEIVNSIIAVLTNNDLSVSEAREILRIVSHKLGEQKITTSF